MCGALIVEALEATQCWNATASCYATKAPGENHKKQMKLFNLLRQMLLGGKEKKLRKDMNAKARAEFAKKKVGQTGNLAKSAVGALGQGVGAYNRRGTGVSQGQDMQGLSGRDKGLTS